jgi:ribosomal protein S1
MIKVELLKISDKEHRLVLTSRETSEQALQELDEVYSLMMGSDPKRGGYLDSRSFEVQFNIS